MAVPAAAHADAGGHCKFVAGVRRAAIARGDAGSKMDAAHREAGKR
jgi:hypothetical protein